MNIIKKIIYLLLSDKPKQRFRMKNKDLTGGAEQQPIDDRDKIHEPAGNTTLPQIVDIRTYSSKIEDQGTYNSCVGQAITTAIETHSKKNGWPHYLELSRMHAWNMARELTWGIFQWKENRGVYTRDCWKAAQKTGIQIEKLFPYNKTNSTKTIHTSFVWRWYPTFKYYWIRRNKKEGIKNVLYHKNAAVVFAIKVSKEFQKIKSLKTWKPTAEERLTFAHAMLIIGYDDRNNTFLIQNSWGTRWGSKGYCRIDQDYLAENAWSVSYCK